MQRGNTMANNKDVIAEWAKPNEWIPIRCKQVVECSFA